MFRDLGRVHIVSFAVGIVGLVIGITGIILAIVFGTSQPTCATPVPPTPCPQQITLPCSTNLFSISTTVNGIKYDPAHFDNPTDPIRIAAIQNITDSLTASLNAGLNSQSSSAFLRILAAETGPTSNNVKVQITQLGQDENGYVIAIGNGAISAAANISTMPTAVNVQNVIDSQNTTYSAAKTTPQACNTTVCPTVVCPTTTPVECTTLPAQTTNTPLPTNPPTSSMAPGTTTTQPTTTVTQTITTTTQPTSTITQPGTTATSQKATSATITNTSPQVTTQTTPGSTSQSTAGTQTVVTTVTTPGSPSTATVPITTTTQGITSTNTPVASTLTTAPSLTTQTTQGSPTPGTSTIPITSTKPASSSTPAVPTTTTQPLLTTSGQPTSQTQTPNPSTVTVPVTSSTASGTSTALPTIGPDQCYYQSNVAVAFELTDPTAAIDMKMQNFIANTLLFYPGNPYQLGNAASSMTKLALVPYPTYDKIEDLMSYGEATDKQRIFTVFNSLGLFAGPDAEINQSLDFISTLPHTGSPGFVIIIGNNGTSVASSTSSSQSLQQKGFSVITVGYNSNADFSPLASNQGYSFKIGQDSDELSVAQQIGNILNSTYCLSTTASPTSPVTTASSVGVQSTSTVTPDITSTEASTVTSTITSAATPAATSSQAPVTSTVPTVHTSTPLPLTSTNPPSPSTIMTSTIPLSSSSAPVQTTSTAQITSTTSPGTSTAQPTLAPGQCYYQSNVAVAFELTSQTSNVDLEIQSFIENNLFFYGGAPYQLGGPKDGKTELSLVPFPNDDTLANLMTYGATTSSSTIKSAMEVFQMLAMEPATISDAFNAIPKNSRQGPPGFVILIANTDTTVPSSVASANNLKNLGFKIITVAFKSAGSFSVLSSDPSYNFQIHQDADQNSVAMSIGNILNTTFCSPAGSTTVGSTVTPGGQTSTVTIPQAPSSSSATTVRNPSTAPPTSSAPSSTVTIPSTPSASSSSMSQSSSTAAYTTSSGSTYSTATAAGSTSQPTQQSSSSPAQQSTTQGGSSSTVLPQTTSVIESSSSLSQQSTTQAGSTSSPSQQTTTQGGSTSSIAQQSSTQGGSTSSPSQRSTTPAGSSSSPSQQTTTPAGSSSSPSQQSSSMGSSSSPAQQTTTQAMSSSSSATSAGTTGSSSSSAPQSSTPSVSSSTVTIPSTIPTSSGTPAPTTSQICPNQQTVFKGQVGVIYEMLPASSQQNTINDFVENILLNTNFYGLAIDNLTNENRTLATAIPYPSTSNYGVQGYGSARSISDFKNQVIAFNAAIQPLTASSDISDALLYVTTNLPAGAMKSSLIIVGNSAKLIDSTATILTAELEKTFDIYTVSVGESAADLSPLSSGAGFSFTGNTQEVANQIGAKMSASNPAVYCPPPIPSTSAPSTPPVTFSSTVPVITTVASTTRFTTVRPTVGPCQCTGRWVYNGDLAIAFEYIKDSEGSTSVVNFITNTLLSNPGSYGLTSDVNGNQASQLTIVPYPDSSDYPIYGYGSIRSPADIGNFVDAFSGVQSASKDPSISSAFDFINTNLKNTSNTRVVLLVGSDGSDVTTSTDSANKLKNAGYTVITVAQTAAATVFQPLSSGSQFAFHIGDGNDNDVANKISNLLLDISFTCFDDGSSTPSPITRCPGTQGTTQPGVTGTSTSAAPVVSTSTASNTVSSTVTVQTTQGSSTMAPSGSSSTVGPTSTMQQGSSSTVAGSSSTIANTGSTVPSGSSSTMGSTVASTSPTVNTASTTIGSTVISGSSTLGSSTAVNTASSTVSSASSTVPNTASTTIGSTVSQGSSTINSVSTSTQPSVSSTSVSSDSTTVVGSTVTTLQASSSSQGSTAVNTGSTTAGSTVTLGSSTAANTGSTTIGSTVTGGSSTAANTESTTAPVQSSSMGSTTENALSSTTAPPLCANPYNGKIATIFELNAAQADIQKVVDFVSDNLYNSANYNFTGATQAINIPYGDTDNQDNLAILQYGEAKSLADLQSNIDTLFTNAPLSQSTDVADGLQWLMDNRNPAGTSGVIIVVGYDDDNDFGATSILLYTLRQQYKVLTVSVGPKLNTFGYIADKPEWYFQVNDSNGQSIANQISYILCNL